MVTTLYLVRHAQAQGNVEGTFQGSTDTPISENGRLQLERLAQRFLQFPIQKVYSSPLRRARQTALALNRYWQAPLRLRRGLLEIQCGDWEGRPWEELKRLEAEEYSVWQTSPHEFCARGGERMAHVYARICGAMQAIARENPGGSVAVVSHGCALRNYLCWVHGFPFEQLRRVPWMEHTGITRVDIREDGVPRLIFENDTRHLDAAMATLSKQNVIYGGVEPSADR